MAKLVYALNKLGIALYQVNYTTKSSVNFRVSRLFNKPYAGGGMKFGNPIGCGNYYQPTIRQAKHLHWEEWAIVNDLINDICDKYDLGGSLKSWFDGELQWVRRNGVQQWWSNLKEYEIDELRLEAQKHTSKAS